MTDQELIESLQQKSAVEFTSAEVEAIRARWTQSPALRQALLEHLQLESRLTGALGTVQLDVETILKRATEQQRSQKVTLPRWSRLIGLCVVLAVMAGLTFLFFQRPVPPQIADNRPAIVAPAVSPDAPKTTTSSTDSEPASDVVIVSPTLEPPANERSTGTSPKPPEPVTVGGDAAEHEPWSAALARDAVALAANSPLLQSPYQATGHDEFNELEAKRWLAPVEGYPYEWATELVGVPSRRTARFRGLSKLRAPWPNDAVLRLTPFEVTDLTLFFWRGPTGVALRFFTRRDPHVWAAFEITRENSSPVPSHFGLLTTDSGSYTRSVPGTLDIRYQEGALVLVRGGITLLSVPFPGPPVEVFVQGQFRLRGLSMHRSEPFPSRDSNLHPVVMSANAGSLDWVVSAERPAHGVSLEDGSLTMSSQSAEKESLLILPIDWPLNRSQSPHATGLYEAIIKVESAEPGTGIYLGDRDGWPQQRLGFFRDSATQQLTFGILRPGENRTESNYRSDDFPTPFLAKSSWFKLVAGLGTFHILCSGDGHHWGHIAESPGRGLPGAVGTVGLFALPGADPRSIRIKQIEIRELSGLTQMANPGLRRLVSPFGQEQLKDEEKWRDRVLETLPVDVDAVDWFSTNAVAALAQGPTQDFGLQLLHQLVEVGLQSSLALEKKRLLLDDAASLCDLFNESAAKSVAAWYAELGWQLTNAGDWHPLKTVRPVWLRSPIWTDVRILNLWERLQSFEILHAIYRHDWNQAWSLSQSSLFWNQLPHPDQRPAETGEALERHARWAKSLAVENEPELDDGTAGVMPLALRHPLVPVLSKEAYNVRAELQSALTGQTYDDACRVVTSIEQEEGPGLLPDLHDRQLYVSMATAIASARRAYPGFATMMEMKYEPLGQLRVKSAINRKDVGALQAATVQFMGTDAARTAHLTLGDLALSAGQFETAEQHFQQALIEASPLWKQKLVPRILLAQATGGRLSQVPAVEDALDVVELNGTSISRADFASLLQDLTQRPSPAGVLVEASSVSHDPVVRGAYRLEPRAHFDGQPGNNPGRHEYRDGDAFGKQLAVASDDQQMVVSNRFQVNAYSAQDGRQLWAQGLGSEQGEAHALPFQPMKPLLTVDSLYVRRLTKSGVELACLNRTNGNLLWQQRPGLGILTDPLIWKGQLFALVLTRQDGDLSQVEATWFDATTGKVLRSKPLFRLRETTIQPSGGQLTIFESHAVCTVGGTVACFNSSGELRWLKRMILMQKPVDELAEVERVAAPVIQAGRVIVSMAGVREVQCLSLESGKMIWEQPLPNLYGLISATASRLLLETATHLLALDTETGAIVWRVPSKTRLEAWCSDDSTLVISRRLTFPSRRSRPSLVWYDLQSGNPLGESVVDVNARDDFQMGPLWSAGGKWWVLVGESWKNPARELHELIVVPAPVPQPFVDPTLKAWKPDFPEAQLAEIQSVLPGWFPAANYRDRLIVHSGEIGGEQNVVVSRINQQSSIRLVSQIELEPGRKHTLRMRVGHRPGQSWLMKVRVANQLVLEQQVGDPTVDQVGWSELSVDLTPWAGQALPIQTIQSTINDSPVEALWKNGLLISESSSEF